MNQSYNLFSNYALAALESNDSATALQIVNNPIGRDLTGTDVDKPCVWPWFRDQVGNESAIIVRAAVEKIIAAKPAEPATNPTAYAFAVNAKSLLTRLDGVGISPCDSELRLALTTIIQMSQDQAVIDAFTKVLHLGYRSHAQKMLGQPATESDFAAARQVYLQRQTETERSNREESLIAELNRYANAGREVIRNGGTVDAAWEAIKAAMVARGR